MGLCCAGNDIVNIAGTRAHQLTRKFAEYYGYIVNKEPPLQFWRWGSSSMHDYPNNTVHKNSAFG